ncbi:MAG: Mrp/NBP35 family ATP-binding protein [Thermoplasmatota archaeon]
MKEQGPAVNPMQQMQMNIKDNLQKVDNMISVMSGKGGVGKTTVAVNLSMALIDKGKKVGLLDADLHGPNVAKMLGLEGSGAMMQEEKIVPIEGKRGLKVFSLSFLMEDQNAPVIWRGPLKINAISEFLGKVNWGELDYLIIDLPPGTGDEALNIAQMLPGSGAIIVSTPQEVALLDSRRSISFARSLKMDIIGIVENMSGMLCPHCGEAIDLFDKGGGEKAADELSIPFLGSVPIDPTIVKGGDSGDPIVMDEKGSPTADSFIRICNNIIQGQDRG